MKIRNTGRYALSFTINLKGRETKINFDKRRLFLDTGNVATEGVTEISDEAYEELKKFKGFTECFEKGYFKEVTDAELSSGKDESEALKAKDEEIRKLKEALKAEKASSSDKEVKKELKEKDKEIASLKAKLESLSKNEAEGF